MRDASDSLGSPFSFHIRWSVTMRLEASPSAFIAVDERHGILSTGLLVCASQSTCPVGIVFCRRGRLDPARDGKNSNRPSGLQRNASGGRSPGWVIATTFHEQLSSYLQVGDVSKSTASVSNEASRNLAKKLARGSQPHDHGRPHDSSLRRRCSARSRSLPLNMVYQRRVAGSLCTLSAAFAEPDGVDARIE